jgi:hypothetical protein
MHHLTYIEGQLLLFMTFDQKVANKLMTFGNWQGPLSRWPDFSIPLQGEAAMVVIKRLEDRTAPGIVCRPCYCYLHMITPG